jgi:hypothetical protein
VLLAWSPVGLVGVGLLAGLLPLLWCVPLLRGEAEIPARTTLLATLLALSSLVWFAWARLQDLPSGGPAYPATTALASLLLFGVTLILIYCGRRRPSLALSAFAHLALFAWLFSYAFTWFGEVP